VPARFFDVQTLLRRALDFGGLPSLSNILAIRRNRTAFFGSVTSIASALAM
jgi:hypothetical protein